MNPTKSVEDKLRSILKRLDTGGYLGHGGQDGAYDDLIRIIQEDVIGEDELPDVFTRHRVMNEDGSYHYENKLDGYSLRASFLNSKLAEQRSTLSTKGGE